MLDDLIGGGGAVQGAVDGQSIGVEQHSGEHAQRHRLDRRLALVCRQRVAVGEARHDALEAVQQLVPESND